MAKPSPGFDDGTPVGGVGVAVPKPVRPGFDDGNPVLTNIDIALAPTSPAPGIVRLPASVLTNVSTSNSPRDSALAVSGEGALIPEIYGRAATVKPRIFAVGQIGSELVLGILWCRGEVDAVEALYSGDDQIATNFVNYTGAAGQGVDPWLAAAISGYADTMPGLCYSSVKLSGDGVVVAQRIRAVIRGIKLVDSREFTMPVRNSAGQVFLVKTSVRNSAGTTFIISNTVRNSSGTEFTISLSNLDVYTTNFALMFRDIALNNGLTTVDSNINAAANYNDELVGGLKRRWGGLLFDKQDSIDNQLALVAEHAGCFYVREAGVVKLVPDAPAAVTHTFTEADIVEGSLTLSKLSLDQLPNQSAVDYTDTSKWPWRSATVQTALPPGDIRGTTFRLSGLQSFAVANRHSIERQNIFNLTDLSIQFEIFDAGLTVEVGDVIEVTHNVGLTLKQFRVSAVSAARFPGSWIINADEYDPAVYSDSIQGEPTFPDISLPNPADVPAGPAPVLTEALFEDEGGKTFSRYEVAFTGVDWPFMGGYRVKVSSGTSVILEQTVAHQGVVAHTATTGPVKQGVLYTAEVWAVNTFGKVGDTPGTDTDTAAGKQLLPTPPTDLTGFEAGQFVSLTWSKGIDLDFIGSVIKRIPKADYDGDIAGAWTHANAVTVQSRVDAEAALLFAQPVGTFYYMVKSLDSLGQESTAVSSPYGRADVQIEVTADGSVSTKSLIQNNSSLVNAHVYEVYGDATYVVSSEGLSWINIFGAAGSAWNLNLNVGDPWNAIDQAASSVETLEWDALSDKRANWVWSLNYQVIQGTVSFTTRLATAAAHPTFTDYSGSSVNASARYFIAKISCTGALGDGMLLRMPFSASFQGKILEDIQTISIPASGQPKAVTWAESFALTPRVTVTLNGSAARIVAADAVTNTGCDLYAWDSAGAAAAATVEVIAIGT